MKKCVFAGSFDPPTLGHKAVIDDCLKMFDCVTVAVMVNPDKKPLFDGDRRKEMLSLMYPREDRIKILFFSGTIASLLEKEGTDIYVRGVRGGTDCDYENANFYSSCKLNKNLVAVYLPCRQELLHVSSGMVRNSLKFGTPIGEYVTEEVEKYIYEVSQKTQPID